MPILAPFPSVARVWRATGQGLNEPGNAGISRLPWRELAGSLHGVEPPHRPAKVETP